MALRITDRLISSDITPEIAEEIANGGSRNWMLSWLPDRPLTREQAVSGMVLDEILSDPDPADPQLAMELAAVRADMLGLALRDVVLRLAIRVVQRELESRAQTDDTPRQEVTSCSNSARRTAAKATPPCRRSTPARPVRAD